MTLKLAIEIKQRTGDEWALTDPDDIDEADRLSIEALKKILYDREPGNRPLYPILPGETFE